VVSEGITIKMNITNCKTDEQVQEYFETNWSKLYKKYGFVFGEMSQIDLYARERQKLIEKCGEQMRRIKEKQ